MPFQIRFRDGLYKQQLPPENSSVRLQIKLTSPNTSDEKIICQSSALKQNPEGNLNQAPTKNPIPLTPINKMVNKNVVVPIELKPQFESLKANIETANKDIEGLINFSILTEEQGTLLREALGLKNF